MPRAILKDGLIHPLEPLPPEWQDGKELLVELIEVEDDSPEAIEQWARELDALCADVDPDDWAKMQAAIDEHRREAKEWMRAYMGLPNEPFIVKADSINP